MTNNEHDTSVKATSFSKTGKKSNLSRKRLAEVVGIVALAIGVALGGGAALSQFPTSVALVNPAQPPPATTPTASITATPDASNGPPAVSGAADAKTGNLQRDKGSFRGVVSGEGN